MILGLFGFSFADFFRGDVEGVLRHDGWYRSWFDESFSRIWGICDTRDGYDGSNSKDLTRTISIVTECVVVESNDLMGILVLRTGKLSALQLGL